MDSKQICKTIDALEEKYLDLWERVCNMESPTSHKDQVDAVGAVFAEMAKEFGWKVDVYPHDKAGDVICLTLNPGAKERPIVFSGHIDTVHPVGIFGTPAVRRDEACIYGPGVTDCKGGVVASMMAMEALMRCGFQKRPVKLIIQTDEETTSKTSNQQTIGFMLDAAKNAVAFLNTELSCGNTAGVALKGILRLRFVVTGKAVHSSSCVDGANAVCEAAHKIIRLETLKDSNGLTCNCGVIRGGTAPNAVAERCEFTADIRYISNEQYRTTVEFCQRVAAESTVNGCACQIETISERPAMPLSEKNTALLRKMNAIYEEAGLPVLEGRAFLIGSDAAFMAQAGIPSVDCLGVEGGNIHSIREFAYLKSLAQCAKRLAVVALCIE